MNSNHVENGRVVPSSELVNPVIFCINDEDVGLVSFDDIPKVIMSVDVRDSASFYDLGDEFICNTCGNLILDMNQAPKNFVWRERLIEMQTREVPPSAEELAYNYTPCDYCDN